jgi:O-antigen ligase
MLFVIRTLLLEGYTAGSRFKIFGENENAAGVLALIAMIGVIWQVLQPSENRGKLKAGITGVYILLMLGLVAMSGSRGSALSLGVTFCTFWFWKSLRPWAKLGLLITILALIFMPLIFTTLIERFTVKGVDALLGGRVVIWQTAWDLISQHFFLGVGIGNSPVHLSPFAIVPGGELMSIHNPILVVWSETGTLGIILYLGVLVSAAGSFVKQYLRYKKLDLDEKFIPYFAIVSSVFLGYSISWIKGGGLQVGYTYFLLIALLLIPFSLDSNEVLGVQKA